MHVEVTRESPMRLIEADRAHGEIVEALELSIASRADQQAGIEAVKLDQAVAACERPDMLPRAVSACRRRQRSELLREAPRIELVGGQHVMRIADIAAVETMLDIEPGLCRTIDADHLHGLIGRRIAGGAAIHEFRQLCWQRVTGDVLRRHRTFEGRQQIDCVPAKLRDHVFPHVLQVEWTGQCAIDQRPCMNRGHQEAHQLLEAIPRHVDADDLSGGVDRGASRHPAVDRARVVDSRIERIFDLPIGDPFGDRQSDVERKANRIGTLPLCRHRAAQWQRLRRETLRADDRQIVPNVDREHRDLSGFAVRRAELETVFFRIENLLRDDVIIRQQDAAWRDRKAGPMKRLRGVGAEKPLDLDDRRPRAGERIACALRQ